jgi:hypothetical protein
MTVSAGCPLPLAPLCDVTGAVGSGIVGTGASDILSAIVGWVVTGASWLLDQIGGVITSTTTVDLGASWYTAHYEAMAAIAGMVALPLLLLAAVQAVVRQSPAVLVRAILVELPLAGLLTAVAAQLVQLALAATDALSSAVSSGTGADISQALTGVATLLVSQAGAGPYSAPAFVVALGALLVVVGALLLWLELLVRAAAAYVAVLFLPLALASLVWPAISHWCRRLVETLAAIVLSKFVIVAVLSLATGALGSGSGFGAVLAGGALLLLAAFTPFTLLRLVPMIEAGAAQQLEGARHRAWQALGHGPSSAASFALHRVRDSGLSVATPGTQTHPEPEPPGGGGVAGAGTDGRPEGGAKGGADAGPPGAAAGARDGTAEGHLGTMPPGNVWQGNAASVRAFEEALRSPKRPSIRGTGGVLPGAPMPLWGGNLPAPSAAGPDDADAPAMPSGTLRFERDDLGPKVRWMPDSGRGAQGPPTSNPEE